MAEKFLNMMKTITPHIQEAQRTQSRINIRKITAIHIIVTLMETNDKKNNFKAPRKK